MLAHVAHVVAGSGAAGTAAAGLQPAAGAAAATTEAVGEAGLAVLDASSNSGLTAEERVAYDQHGLVVPSAVLSPATAAALQTLVKRTLEVTCAASPPVEMPVAPHCPTSLYGRHGSPIPEDIAAVWMALCRHPTILDKVCSVSDSPPPPLHFLTFTPFDSSFTLAYSKFTLVIPAIVNSQVLGPDVILWGAQLFHKPAGTGERTYRNPTGM